MSSRERSAVAVVLLALTGGSGGAAVATVVARAMGAQPLLPAAAGTLTGIIAACLIDRRHLASRLPEELDGWFARRRVLSIVWIVAAVLAVVNTARIGLFVAEPTEVWASALPPIPESAKHQCLSAYVRAGELAANGTDDLWLPARYAQDATSAVHGIAPYLGDPYEYPPPFAVLPRAGLALTDDYQILRAAWFGIGAVAFWLAFVALALWMRGRAGATSLLLAPVVALSFPFVLNLQWGQAHLVVIAAAIGGMVAFARGRTIAGGVLLAFATATKLFPGLLLVHLAVRRQWRAVFATVVALAAMCGVAALVLGPSTFTSFVSDQLPRIASGEAFAFAEDNPDNYSLYGLAFKLRTLGVDGAGRELAGMFAWIWTGIAVVFAVLGSLRRRTPGAEAMLWLGLICVGTLRSPFAPIYSQIGTLWLLSVAAGVARKRLWLSALVAISWILLQGSPPFFGPAGNAAASLPGQLVAILVAVLAVFPFRRLQRDP